MEVLIPTAAIRNLIREDKIHQIYSAMQTGVSQTGMQTFNQSLANAYFNKLITLEIGSSRSSNPDELQDMINRGFLWPTMQSPVGARGCARAAKIARMSKKCCTNLKRRLRNACLHIQRKNRSGAAVTGENRPPAKPNSKYSSTPANQCHQNVGEGQGIQLAHLRRGRQFKGNCHLHATVLRDD